MANALTDRAWIEICEAAGLIPDADARAETEACLFVEYPGMATDSAHVAAMQRRALRIGKQAAHLAALLRRQMAARRNPPTAENDPLWRDLRHAHAVFQGARIQVLGYRAILRANARRKDAQREWLMSRLCGIWLDNFHARDLTVTVPPLGGPPRGPLIKFLLAAMWQIIPRSTLPAPETLRDGIDRERDGRANAAQLRLDLQQRKVMGF